MNETSGKNIADAHQTLTCSNSERLLLKKSARRMALRQLQKAISENEERIYEALKDDLGRARFETYVAEVAFVKAEINCALKSLDTWCRKRIIKTPIVLQPGGSYVEPTPKGVVLIIAPWNYPFQLSLVPLVSAIAAGNCAIIKPSEVASHSAVVIADIVNNYLDHRCFRAICGDLDTAVALLDLPFDHIFYTGSTIVGSEVMKKAARHLTPVTLELGGKSPAIVDSSCDLSLAVKRILWGKCLNAGQTCIAPDYVLIEKRLVDEFLRFAKQHLLSMFGKDVAKSDSYSRIVNDRHFTRLKNYFGEGRIAIGGGYDQANKFIEPTILLDVDLNAPVMREEIFGPILPLIPINKLDDAIAFINRRPHPLALYMFSNDKSNVQAVLDRTISGSVAINECVSHVAIIDLPFGGVRHSGMGSYHGIYGFETFSHMRSVYKRSNLLDNPIKYAPYSEKKLKIAKMLL